MTEADYIKLISESLDDINYNDIGDDFQDDEFYNDYDDDIWHHDDYTEAISLSPLDYEVDDEDDEDEKLKGLTESLDDINYNDIGDDSSTDEFYNRRIGGDWVIEWEDKRARGLWYVDDHHQRCGHKIEYIKYIHGRFLYKNYNDDDIDGNDIYGIHEVNINLNAILGKKDFWKYAHRYLEDIITGPCMVGYWDNDNEELYSGRKVSSIEPGLKNNLIKLRWVYTSDQAPEDDYDL